MQHPQRSARVKTAYIEDGSKSRALLCMAGFMGFLLLVTSMSSYAGNHCCMQNPLLVVTTQAVNSLGYRSAWTQQKRLEARQAYEGDEHHLARRLWVALANTGDAESAFRLGMVYDTADGVKHDSERAVYWYRRAAEQGNKHAQHNLAVAYANGDGVELNIDEALKWWHQAARQGNSDSQYNLGIIYAVGSHGITRNIETAKQWWRMAAISGDALAQYNLGTLYANAEGQVRSYCEAARWWEKSANAGIKQAGWALEVIKTHRDYRACW